MHRLVSNSSQSDIKVLQVLPFFNQKHSQQIPQKISSLAVSFLPKSFRTVSGYILHFIKGVWMINIFFWRGDEGWGKGVLRKRLIVYLFQTESCQNYYLGMESKLHMRYSKENSDRPRSLQTKIKIRTCKLPRDFFRGASLDKPVRSACISRESTRDNETAPSTPSFGQMRRESSEQLRSSRKAETAQLISSNKMAGVFLSKSETHHLNRRVLREVRDRFPVLELPPIYSNRVFLDL